MERHEQGDAAGSSAEGKVQTMLQVYSGMIKRWWDNGQTIPKITKDIRQANVDTSEEEIRECLVVWQLLGPSDRRNRKEGYPDEEEKRPSSSNGETATPETTPELQREIGNRAGRSRSGTTQNGAGSIGRGRQVSASSVTSPQVTKVAKATASASSRPSQQRRNSRPHIPKPATRFVAPGGEVFPFVPRPPPASGKATVRDASALFEARIQAMTERLAEMEDGGMASLTDIEEAANLVVAQLRKGPSSSDAECPSRVRQVRAPVLRTKRRLKQEIEQLQVQWTDVESKEDVERVPSLPCIGTWAFTEGNGSHAAALAELGQPAKRPPSVSTVDSFDEMYMTDSYRSEKRRRTEDSLLSRQHEEAAPRDKGKEKEIIRDDTPKQQGDSSISESAKSPHDNWMSVVFD